MMSHWKLRGWISVVQQVHDSFLLQLQLEDDLIFMLNHGSWLLQGYFILLCPWNPNTSLIDVSAQTPTLWIQAHGLPKNYHNEGIAQLLGNKLGKFICFDNTSGSNSYGLRFKISLSQQGLDYRNLSSLFINNGQLSDLSLVLEQVGRFCPSCLQIGHVAKHCNPVSCSQYQTHISLVGLKSVKVKYDEFFGVYISYFRENGIKLQFKKGRQNCKRKLDHISVDTPYNKRSRIVKVSSRKRCNEHLPSSFTILNKRAKLTLHPGTLFSSCQSYQTNGSISSLSEFDHLTFWPVSSHKRKLKDVKVIASVCKKSKIEHLISWSSSLPPRHFHCHSPPQNLNRKRKYDQSLVSKITVFKRPGFLLRMIMLSRLPNLFPRGGRGNLISIRFFLVHFHLTLLMFIIFRCSSTKNVR